MLHALALLRLIMLLPYRFNLSGIAPTEREQLILKVKSLGGQLTHEDEADYHILPVIRGKSRPDNTDAGGKTVSSVWLVGFSFRLAYTGTDLIHKVLELL